MIQSLPAKTVQIVFLCVTSVRLCQKRTCSQFVRHKLWMTLWWFGKKWQFIVESTSKHTNMNCPLASKSVLKLSLPSEADDCAFSNLNVSILRYVFILDSSFSLVARYYFIPIHKALQKLCTLIVVPGSYDYVKSSSGRCPYVVSFWSSWRCRCAHRAYTFVVYFLSIKKDMDERNIDAGSTYSYTATLPHHIRIRNHFLIGYRSVARATAVHRTFSFFLKLDLLFEHTSVNIR